MKTCSIVLLFIIPLSRNVIPSSGHNTRAKDKRASSKKHYITLTACAGYFKRTYIASYPEGPYIYCFVLVFIYFQSIWCHWSRIRLNCSFDRVVTYVFSLHASSKNAKLLEARNLVGEGDLEYDNGSGQPVYCKSGNFRENFIFAKSHICGDKNSRQGHDLCISRGFYFHDTSHMRSFAKIKPSRKFPNLQNTCGLNRSFACKWVLFVLANSGDRPKYLMYALRMYVSFYLW